MTIARRLAAVPIALAPVLLLGSGCSHPGGEAAARASEPGAAPVARVATVAPQRGTIRRTVEQPGQIEAFEVTPLHAKLAGYVESIAVDIGDRVKKGQVLARLRVPEVEADLREKRALVEEARAGLRQAEASVEVARAGVTSAEAKVEAARASTRRAEADVARWEAEYARVEQLARERAQTGSLVDETRSKLQAARAGREEVSAEIHSAEAALAEAKAGLTKSRSQVATASSHVEVAQSAAEHAEAIASYAAIVAPYDGIVTRRQVDTGRLTTPGTTGDPLFVVARADKVTISVGVPEAEAARVEAGDAAQVRLPALDGKTFAGKVTRTSWALDPGTRTLLAEIDLEDPALRPGLYAHAAIIAEEHKDALTVPSSALFKDGGKAYVTAVEGGKARRKEVRPGLVEGKRIEIVSGLEADERIVEANGASLADGQAVEEVRPPASDAKPKS